MSNFHAKWKNFINEHNASITYRYMSVKDFKNDLNLQEFLSSKIVENDSAGTDMSMSLLLNSDSTQGHMTMAYHDSDLVGWAIANEYSTINKTPVLSVFIEGGFLQTNAGEQLVEKLRPYIMKDFASKELKVTSNKFFKNIFKSYSKYDQRSLTVPYPYELR